MRVAIFGTGRTAGELLRQARAAGHDVVAGITSDAAKEGADLGTLCGEAPVGATATRDLPAVLARGDVDVLLYAGMGGAPLADAFAACAAAGVDAIAVSGVVHPPTALGATAAAQLDATARSHGARLLSTGVNPGLLFDVLPALLATAVPGPVTISARRIASIAGWGPEVLRNEIGVGGPPEDASDELGTWIGECAALLAEATGIDLERVEHDFRPLPAERPAQVGGIAIAPGQVAGFRHLVVGHAGGEPRITLEWAGALSTALDWPEPATELRIDGASPVWATLGGGFSQDPYPSTVARVLKSIASLRTLPPGLHRPDQLPVSP